MLCGGSLPPPVLSYHSVMVLQFASDASVAHRGFRASLTFISRTGESPMDEKETTPTGLCYAMNSKNVIRMTVFFFLHFL